MKKILVTLGGLWFAWSGFAQVDTTATPLKEVTITAASKFEQQRKDSGKPVVKITQEDIERQAAASLADLLNQYAGIEINGGRSNAGQNLGYFIRGGNNRQVSFLIDGAQVSDASSIANDFDLRLIPLDQIEEIEILKGASSTLYGANASTAVINIKLKEASKKPLAVSLSSFVGTNQPSDSDNRFSLDEVTTNIYASGRTDKGLTYGFGFSHQSTDGLSAIAATENETSFDGDPFNRVNLIGRIGYDNKKDFKLTSYFSFDEYKASFDDSFAYSDADNETYSRQTRWGTNMIWNYADGLELVYNDVSTHTRRDTRSGFPSIFNADGYSLDIYNRFTKAINDDVTLKLITGFNMRLDQYESFSIPFGGDSFEQDANSDDVNTQIFDPYVNAVFETDWGFNINSGLRYNIHSNYDSALIYNLNPSYNFDINDNTTLKLYSSVSSAYITPSLFQLYAAGFGNEDLRPEENKTIEMGLEIYNRKSMLSVSFFNRRETNLVIFTTVDPVNFISEYQNNPNVLRARGVEVNAQTELGNRIYLNANYTFTERDEESILRRMPKHKLNASARVKLADRKFVTLRYQYSDLRGDVFFNPNTFTSENVSLDPFNLIDVDFTYTLKEKPVTFFAGVSNLFNEDYQELFRYETRGLNSKIGVRLQF